MSLLSKRVSTKSNKIAQKDEKTDPELTGGGGGGLQIQDKLDGKDSLLYLVSSNFYIVASLCSCSNTSRLKTRLEKCMHKGG